MTRKICLISLGLQIVLFTFILWISQTDDLNDLTGSNPELIFKISSFAFIFLFPFGLASFGLSMTFILMWKINAFPTGFKRQTIKDSPIMFFVWKEVRERLNVYDIGEDNWQSKT